MNFWAFKQLIRLKKKQVARKIREWMPFDEARTFVHALNLKTGTDWSDYCEFGDLPYTIPKSPQTVYREKGWKGIEDWLGTCVVPSEQKYLPFNEARLFAHSLQFKKSDQWRKYCKSGLKPRNIPSSPQNFYITQGWVGWPDWLGLLPRFRMSNNMLPFEQARKFVHKQQIKSNKEWYEWCKLGKNPDNIPAYPNNFYKDKGWIGWRDWLGPR